MSAMRHKRPALICVAFSQSAIATGTALIIAGAAWMASLTSFNITIQLAAPRWVAGRALAAYQASISGGVAIGSWVWGNVADAVGTSMATLGSGLLMVAFVSLGLWLRMPDSNPSDTETQEALSTIPEVALPLTGRSGPMVIEIEYRVDPMSARRFYNAMLALQLARQRNGAYGWTLSRDIANPELWIERYHCPTWHDYLRLRESLTAAERSLERTATGFHFGGQLFRVRRLLERPFGSVRWKENTPDPSRNTLLPRRRQRVGSELTYASNKLMLFGTDLEAVAHPTALQDAHIISLHSASCPRYRSRRGDARAWRGPRRAVSAGNSRLQRL